MLPHLPRLTDAGLFATDLFPRIPYSLALFSSHTRLNNRRAPYAESPPLNPVACPNLIAYHILFYRVVR